jgi:hypothetical protein
VQLFDVLTADFDMAFVFAGGGEVIGELHAQPRFWRTAERFEQTYGHLRAYTRLAVHDVIESLAGDAEGLCSGGNRESQRLKAIVADDVAGMNGIFHGDREFFLPIV